VTTFSIGYTLLGDPRFGTVDWRAGETASSKD
jgi:hypothetical protein